MKYENIEESQYFNESGHFNLVLGEDGNYYIEMEAGYPCNSYFGPLTDEQLQAFYTLLDVEVFS